MVSPILSSIYLAVKCQSTAVVLVGPLVGSYEIESVHPSILLSVGFFFLELDHLVSLNFDMILENLIARFFGKAFFAPPPPKSWGNGQK